MEASILLINAAVLDVVAGRLVPNQQVVIKGGRIARVEASGTPSDIPPDRVIDMRGLTVMPGLCDAHVHVTAWTANLAELMRTSPAYTALRTVEILEDMLQRG